MEEDTKRCIFNFRIYLKFATDSVLCGNCDVKHDFSVCADVRTKSIVNFPQKNIFEKIIT